uniref:Uncharacterized protein n=1 Tax=Trichogramma kaykai TaxID=54128 RepID=A0ABD2WHA6_9HYME
MKLLQSQRTPIISEFTSRKHRVTKEGHQSCKTSICANIVYSKSQKSSRCVRNTVKRTQQQQLSFNVWRIARPINSQPRIRKREKRIDKYPCYKYVERRPRAKHPKAVVSSHEAVLDMQKDIGESSGRCMRLSRETKLAKRRQSRYLQLEKINEMSYSGHGISGNQLWDTGALTKKFHRVKARSIFTPVLLIPSNLKEVSFQNSHESILFAMI